ncbi:MAG: ATP-binding cassette domain-containing protein [Ruminococcaceae bacterium]|nr:ATP-binding cassette domain-containing protein [Oscillospiraceae bacterium]
MIEVKHLVKRYGDFEAVRDVSFTVEKGRIYGFLGPNGAGKSTTMNIITGCLAATEGEVTINGYDIYEDPVEAKSCIGYLPELPPLYTDMTPEEYLYFVGKAKGLKGKALEDGVDRVIAKTSLTPMRSRLIKNLSKGYRQRVGIAQAILGDPEIIILDEPTVGLDPLQIIEIRDLIRELGQNHTVILSSHILTEISAVCDYVIIIAAGKIVASDTIENLTKLNEGKSYIDMDVRGSAEAVEAAAGTLQGVAQMEVRPGENAVHLRLEVEGKDDIRDHVFFTFAERRLPIIAMQYEEVTLEKVFLALTESQKRDRTEDTETQEDTRIRAEDIFGQIGMRREAEAEKTAADVPVEEPAPVPAAEETQKDDDGDDYKPLFGGN